MAEHTPGPWVVGITIDGLGWPTYRLRDMNDPHDKKECQANARLIAAAPDLLEACEALLDSEAYVAEDWLPTMATEARFYEVLEMSRTAIRKTKGES